MAPTAPPAGQQISARLPDEDRVARDVEEQIRRTAQNLEGFKLEELSRDRQELVASARDFLVKAREALAGRDLLRARTLTEKAAKLAEELGPRPSRAR